MAHAPLKTETANVMRKDDWGYRWLKLTTTTTTNAATQEETTTTTEHQYAAAKDGGGVDWPAFEGLNDAQALELEWYGQTTI